eukprot:SAG31_NODE_242_length_19350_cov_3.043998_7_plen_101_part_00
MYINACTQLYVLRMIKLDQSPCDTENNTYGYACIRTIVIDTRAPRRTEAEITADGGNCTENRIYCEFLDAENFKEYYDLSRDRCNMRNIYDSLEPIGRRS